MLIVFLLGWILHWRTLNWIMLAITSIIAFLHLFLIPETPYYLISTGNIEKAKSILQSLRGSDCNISDEFHEMIRRHEYLEENRDQSLNKIQIIFGILKSRNFLKPFSIIGVIYGLSQLTGICSLIMYLVNVFEESGSEVNPYLASVLVAGIRTIVSGFSSILIKVMMIIILQST